MAIRPTVTVVGRRLGSEDHRLRDFLTRIAQPYEWVEAQDGETDLPRLIEQDGAARAGGLDGGLHAQRAARRRPASST